MTLAETLGVNLRRYRLAAGLTLDQVADLAGMLTQVVADAENGRNPNLTIGEVDNLADALGRSRIDLLRAPGDNWRPR